MPTSSPARLRTGLPELPPMVSAVETKLNGVARSSLSLPSSQRSGRSNGSLAAERRGLLERLAEGGVEGELLAADLVTLHDAERQPQGEGRVRCDRFAEDLEPQLGQLGIGLPLRFLHFRSRSACAAARASASIGLREQDHRVGARVDGLLAALDEPLPLGRVEQLGAGDQFVGPGRGVLAGQDRVSTIGWSPPRFSARKVSDAVSLRALQVRIDRRGTNRRELERFEVGVAILAQPIGGLLGQLLGHADAVPGDA